MLSQQSDKKKHLNRGLLKEIKKYIPSNTYTDKYKFTD